jgi:hypothetical protein
MYRSWAKNFLYIILLKLSNYMVCIMYYCLLNENTLKRVKIQQAEEGEDSAGSNC